MDRDDRRPGRKQGTDTASSRLGPGLSFDPRIDDMFAAAVTSFRAGDLAQAEKVCREILNINRSHADALHLMGMIGFQLGRYDAAYQLLSSALKIDSRNADCHVNLAQVLRALGHLDDAATHLIQAITLNRDHTAARMALGDVYLQQGKLDEAKARYARAVTLEPQLLGAHYGLGNVAIQQGRLEDAIAHYRKVLAINPNHAETCSNIGVALAGLGNPDEAATWYQRAIALKPGLIDVYRNFIRLLIAQGRAAEALAMARRALAIQEADEIKILLVQCIKLLPSDVWPPGIPDLIARALSEGWTRPGEIAWLAAEVLRKSAPLGACIDRVVAAWPERLPGQELWGEEGLAAMAQDRLVRALLESAPVRDLDLERFLTVARASLLEMTVTAEAAPPVDILGIAGALARQCFINEYVFAETEAEASAVSTLDSGIADAISAAKPVPALHLAMAAAYRPVHALRSVEHILRRPWPGPVAALVDQQLREPRQEKEIRTTIPALTEIDDEVSLKVRRQYEDMPYPRWVKPGLIARPVTIEWYLRNQFPNAPIQDYGRHGALDVLVAGCGTGQHAIESARRFAGARVTALDLSLTSLSYAIRMSRGLNLPNVRYAQADILRLGDKEDRFDVIEASGVLHHLRDWAEGWRILLSLLRPGGFMNIGLYSAIARSDIRAARTLIAECGYGTSADEIRRCRQDLLANEDGSPLKNVSKFSDFYSTSECRDLIFHVQEHQLTLAEIKDFLGAHQLTFIGFSGVDLRKFRERFPDEEAMRDLDRWHEFETENPTSFVGMYQFWIQKPMD